MYTRGGSAYLTIYHANTLICDLEPNFAAQTNDKADVVLGPSRVTSIGNQLTVRCQKDGGV